MSEKNIAYFEKKRGCIIKDADPETKITEKEFDAIPLTEKIGVNHVDRIKFLEDNGYDISRENMINSELSCIEE